MSKMIANIRVKCYKISFVLLDKGLGMRIDEFDYSLPKEMIAQEPAADRCGSRLLVLHKEDGSIEHRNFGDVVEYLQAGDVLVLNDTKVLPARLTARKATGGAVNVLLVEPIDGSRWACLVDGASRGAREMEVTVGGEKALLERTDQYWHIEFPGT